MENNKYKKLLWKPMKFMSRFPQTTPVADYEFDGFIEGTQKPFLFIQKMSHGSGYPNWRYPVAYEDDSRSVKVLSISPTGGGLKYQTYDVLNERDKLIGTIEQKRIWFIGKQEIRFLRDGIEIVKVAEPTFLDVLKRRFTMGARMSYVVYTYGREAGKLNVKTILPHSYELIPKAEGSNIDILGVLGILLVVMSQTESYQHED